MAYLVNWSKSLRDVSFWFPCPFQAKVYTITLANLPLTLGKILQGNAQVVIRMQMYYFMYPLSIKQHPYLSHGDQSQLHSQKYNSFPCVLVSWHEELRVMATFIGQYSTRLSPNYFKNRNRFSAVSISEWFFIDIGKFILKFGKMKDLE